MDKIEDSKIVSLSLSTSIISKNEITKEQEKQRYYIFDNFKGILIFTVVFAHFLWSYSDQNRNTLSRKIVVFIYFFHMPSFIFISGFLTSKNSEKISNSFKLIILYYIFNFSFVLIIHFYINSNIGFFYPYYSYWYLLSLFYWRISINYIYRLKFIFIISIIVCLLVGYWSCFSNILSIVRTFTYFPFFLSGYIISKNGKFNKFLKWKKSIIKFIFFCILFVIFLLLFIKYIVTRRISNTTLLTFSYDKSSTIKDRIMMISISFIMIAFSLLLFPNGKIPLINKWGKNSLYIYLFHRIFTIIAHQELFKKKKYSKYIIEFSILFSLIILFIFGSDIVTKRCNFALNFIHKNFLESNFKGKVIGFIFCLSFISLLSIKPFEYYYNIIKTLKNTNDIKATSFIKTPQNNIMQQKLNKLLNNSIRISYIGDLILLKGQVTSAKNNITGKYEFDDIFKYTSKHFHESDLTIGVYEGPSAGNNTSYSTSNYGDGIPIYLNFPDEFAESVKKAGIDLVSTANNHLLDKKIAGAMRTIDILDKYNISHVGSYRNKEEKDRIFTINIKGIKIAVLAYTSFLNYYKAETIYNKFNYLTNIIPKVNNKYYDEIYKNIKNDFIKAKKESPDIIIVLAHMGTQFLHTTNQFQDKWNKIFSDLGANIILGDHSHAVQPLQYIGNTFIANSPGNFANSYIKKDGDATAIIDIYIDKLTKKVIGSSAIPMYTKEIRKNYFSAIPIYDLINDNLVPLNEYERKRVEEIQLMSTKVLVGKEIGINEIKKNYFFINNSYYDFDTNLNDFCSIINKYSNKVIYKHIVASKSITFIGDSITEGTKNGFHPWYEPMINCFKNKKIKNISKGTFTTKLIIKNFSKDIIKSNTDLYIIAIGTNDIRYRRESICAMNSKIFIEQIKKIVNLVQNKKAKFIFIAPWYSTSDDMYSKLNHKDKLKLNKQYSLEIENFARKKKYIYINTNDYLEKHINMNKRKYLVDFIHPNNKEGIKLYSEAVFAKSK